MRNRLAITLVVTLALGFAWGCGGGTGLRPTNTPPTADAQASRTYVKPTIDVSFDGSGTTDPEQPAADLAYHWDFGHDGQTGTGIAVTHAFPSAGAYTVTLTVTDALDATGTDTVVIDVSVGGAPTALVDMVTVKGTLTDDSQPDDHVDVTVTPPGTVTQAAVNVGTGEFSHSVAVGGVAITVDAYGEDWARNPAYSDTSQVVIQP